MNSYIEKLAEEVYRIIPQLKNIVEELLIQKYTGNSSKYWTEEFVKKSKCCKTQYLNSHLNKIPE